MKNNRLYIVMLALGLVGVSSLAQASQTTGDWQYRASIYGFLPSIGGASKFPAQGGGSDISIDSDKVLDSLEFAFMGNLEVNNGEAGLFVDVLYVDLGVDRQWTPLGSSASIGYGVEGWVWTMAAEYRVASDDGLTLDVLAGARSFDITQTLDWKLTTTPGVSPSGESSIDTTLWDGIVGIKGRYVLGDSHWALPFYADVGTGDSDLTWQVAAGVGYAFSWGEVNALWRELNYDLGDDGAVYDFNFSGPQLGLTFVW